MEILRILLCELFVELFDFGQQDLELVFRRQDGHSGEAKGKEEEEEEDKH